jgi:DNA-binding GntR family transcriptional regulator
MSAAAPKRKKSSVLQDVYRVLKEDIFNFRLPPGQRYSEHELAAALGVSRTPLRFALHVLAREGHLVRREGHSCWQVQPLDLDHYEDLYDFRTDIEALAVHRICRALPNSELEELAAYWHSREARRTKDFKAVADADEHFHRTLVALAGNREMLRTFDQLTDRIRIIRRLDFAAADRISTTFDEHGEILRLLMAGGAAVAEAAVRAHIESSRREIRKITLHHIAKATERGLQAAARRAG